MKAATGPVPASRHDRVRVLLALERDRSGLPQRQTKIALSYHPPEPSTYPSTSSSCLSRGSAPALCCGNSSEQVRERRATATSESQTFRLPVSNIKCQSAIGSTSTDHILTRHTTSDRAGRPRIETYV